MAFRVNENGGAILADMPNGLARGFYLLVDRLLFPPLPCQHDIAVRPLERAVESVEEQEYMAIKDRDQVAQLLAQAPETGSGSSRA